MYTFESQDYIKYMPYGETDQFRGRKHKCPICNKKVWSTWGQANKHWMSHRLSYLTKTPKGREEIAKILLQPILNMPRLD